MKKRTETEQIIEKINDIIIPFQNHKNKKEILKAILEDLTQQYKIPKNILQKTEFNIEKLQNIKTQNINKLLNPQQQIDYEIRKTALNTWSRDKVKQTKPSETNKQKYIKEIQHGNKIVQIDTYIHTINILTENINRNGEISRSTPSLVINAEPIKISEVQNNITRTHTDKNPVSIYEIIWKYHNGRERKIRGTLKQISTTLYENGSVGLNITQYAVQNTIGQIIDAAIENNEITIITSPPEKGFYINPDTNEFINVNYTPEKPTKHNIHVALNTLNQLIEYFDSTIIAEIVRWGLKSPYYYMIKQNGGEGQFLYIEGEPNTGKSKILGAIPLYIWDMEPSKNTYGGATRSMAQLSEVMSKTTFPQIIDDFASINTVSTNSLIKSAAIGLQSRSKYDNNNNFKEYPALSPIIFTSNNQLNRDIEDTAHLRRFRQLHLHREHIPTTEQQEQFNKAFQVINKKQNKLKNLRYLGHAFYYYMQENPTCIQYDPEDEAIIKFIYTLREKTHYNLPIEWLKEKTEKETLQDMEETMKENLLNKLAELVQGRNPTIIRYDDTGRHDESAHLTTLQDQIDARIRYREIPWLYQSKDEENYFITTEIRKDLKELNMTLPKLAGLLGWKYTNHRINGIQKRSVKVNKQEFIDTIFNPYFDE